MRKTPKLTPWFPAGIKPARRGFYQRKYREQDCLESPDLWNGEYWILFDIYGERSLKANDQNMPWRGLAEKP